MRSLWITVAVGVVLACGFVASAVVLRASSVNSAKGIQAEAAIVRPVAGTGIHFLTTMIVHSVEPTQTGLVQRSTETVDLTGDLTGRILYHPTTVVDFSSRTATNTPLTNGGRLIMMLLSVLPQQRLPRARMQWDL